MKPTFCCIYLIKLQKDLISSSSLDSSLLKKEKKIYFGKSFLPRILFLMQSKPNFLGLDPAIRNAMVWASQQKYCIQF